MHSTFKIKRRYMYKPKYEKTNSFIWKDDNLDKYRKTKRCGKCNYFFVKIPVIIFAFEIKHKMLSVYEGGPSDGHSDLETALKDMFLIWRQFTNNQ